MNNDELVDIETDVSNISTWTYDLNRYWHEKQIAKYAKLLDSIKDKGYKVLRNGAGEHKIMN